MQYLCNGPSYSYLLKTVKAVLMGGQWGEGKRDNNVYSLCMCIRDGKKTIGKKLIDAFIKEIATMFDTIKQFVEQGRN